MKNKKPTKAIELFNTIDKPNEIILTLLLNACAQIQTKESLNLVKKILSSLPKSLNVDHFLLTSLLDALMNCGDIKSAESVFNRITRRFPEMYGAMIKGLSRLSQFPLNEQLAIIFKDM